MDHLTEWLFGGLFGLQLAVVVYLESRIRSHEQLRAHSGAAADMEAMRRAHDELREMHNRDLTSIEQRVIDLERRWENR